MRSNSTAKLVKKLRAEHKISQRKLSELSGVSFPQIQRIELGTSNTTIETLNKLLKVFNMQVEFRSIEPS